MTHTEFSNESTVVGERLETGGMGRQFKEKRRKYNPQNLCQPDSPTHSSSVVHLVFTSYEPSA